MFRDRARKALAEAGINVLDLLAANPGVSVTELAKRLNRGTSGLGLTMVAFEEASQGGHLRETAKDLLIRRILRAFPNGWLPDANVHPSVMIGAWDSDIERYAKDRTAAVYAFQILRVLTIESPPVAGWKPNAVSDPQIDTLFDRHWPKACPP
jgi:hypothetical protein